MMQHADGRETVLRPEVVEFVTYLRKERNDSPNTVTAYRRDLEALQSFCNGYFAGDGWEWSAVDRLALRSYMGELNRRGLSKRSIARAMSVVRTFYRFLGVRYGMEENPAKGLRLPKRCSSVGRWKSSSATPRPWPTVEGSAPRAILRCWSSSTQRECDSRSSPAWISPTWTSCRSR